MSYHDVRKINNVNNNSVTSSYVPQKAVKSDNNIGEKLSNADTGNCQFAPTDNNTKTANDIQKKINALETTLKDYTSNIEINLTLKDLFGIIQNKLGYTKDELLKLDMQEFNRIGNKLENEYLETVLSEIQAIVNGSEKVKDLINDTLAAGGDLDTALKIAKLVGDADSISSIINNITGKNYQSVAEVSEEELENVIKIINDKFSNSKGLQKGILINKIHDLGKSLSNEEQVKLQNAFEKALPKETKRIQIIVELVMKYKKDPKAFKEYLQSGSFSAFCKKHDFNTDMVIKFLNTMMQAADRLGDDPRKWLEEIKSAVSFDKKFEQLQEKQKNNEPLSEDDKKFLEVYPKVKEIKAKKEKDPHYQLTEDEQKILDLFDGQLGKINEFIQVACDGMIADYSGDINAFYNSLKNKPKLLAAFIAGMKENVADFKVDTKYLDYITNGKFSEALENYYNEHPATNNSADSSNLTDTEVKSSESSTGLGFTTAPQNTYENAAKNIAAITEQIRVSKPSENSFTIESPAEDEKKIPETKGKTVKLLISSNKFFDFYWNMGIIKVDDIAKNYQEASSKAAKKVWTVLDTNPKDRVNCLNRWNNSKLSNEAVVKYNLAPEDIEKLNLSEGQKLVLKARFEQLHKNDKRYKENIEQI